MARERNLATSDHEQFYEFLEDESSIAQQTGLEISYPLRLLTVESFGLNFSELRNSLTPLFSDLSGQPRLEIEFDCRLYGDEWRIHHFESSREENNEQRETSNFKDELLENAPFTKLLSSLCSIVRDQEMHAERVIISLSLSRSLVSSSHPVEILSPDGIHQHGADYVSTLVINRHGVSGGESCIVDEEQTVKYLTTALEPGQAIFHADSESPFWHYETPCCFDESTGEVEQGVLDILHFELQVERSGTSISPTRGLYHDPDSVEGGIGAFGASYHYEMVSDEERIKPFRTAIERVCKGKVVLECGAGTGLMSILAAKAGAAHVYAVELDPKMAEVVRRNVHERNLTSKVTVINQKIQEVLPIDLNYQQAEVIIAENLSTWLVTEPQLLTMNYMNKHLAAADCLRIPESIENRIELAEAQYDFQDAVTFRTYYHEFSGIKTPSLLSQKATFHKLDFKDKHFPRFQGSVRIQASHTGTVNALRLTSYLQVLDDIYFEYSDSLLPPVVFPLPQSIQVEKGQDVLVSIQFQSFSNWNTFRASAQVEQ